MKRSKKQSSRAEFIPKEVSKGQLDILKKIILAIGAGLVIAVFFSLFFRIWDPLWNPFRLSPQEVLSRAGGKETDSFNERGTFVLKIDSEPETRLSFNFKGYSDDQSSAWVNFNGFFPDKGSVSWDMEKRKIENDHYVRLSFPFYIRSLLDSYKVDFDEINEEWIRFDKDYFDSEKKLFETIKSVLKEERYEVEKELSDKLIGETIAYHYVLSLDSGVVQESLPAFLRNLMKFEKEMETGLEIENSINEFLDDLERVNFEIWISKKDMNIYRIRTEKKTDFLDLKFETNYFGFDQEIEIALPDRFKEFDEVLN